MKQFFRIVAFLEGGSYLLLLFIAVPFKYWGENEQYVKILGMPHGLLFVTYIMLAFLLKHNENWTFKDLIIIMMAAILPFGTFFIDIKYLRK